MVHEVNNVYQNKCTALEMLFLLQRLLLHVLMD